MRITISCPEAHIPDARNLAMVLGYGPADADTYTAANWQDAQGNKYACASLPVDDTFVTKAISTLVRPEWDVEPYRINMAAASRAQAAVVMSEVPQQATPDAILAVVGDDGAAMVAAMGLTHVDDF